MALNKSKKRDLQALLSPTASRQAFTSPKPSQKQIGFTGRNLPTSNLGQHSIHSVPIPPISPQLGDYIKAALGGDPGRNKQTRKRTGFKEGIIVAPTLVNMPHTSSPTQSNLHINISVGGPVKKITVAKKKKVKKNQSCQQSQSNVGTSKLGPSAASTAFGGAWLNSKRGPAISSPGSTLRPTEHEERNSIRKEAPKVMPGLNHALLQRVLFDAGRINTDANHLSAKQKNKTSSRMPTQPGWVSPQVERIDTLASRILAGPAGSGTKRLRSTKSPSARLTLDSSERVRNSKINRETVPGSQFLGLRNSAKSPEPSRSKALLKVPGSAGVTNLAQWKMLSPKGNSSNTNRLNSSQEGKGLGLLGLGSPHSLKKPKKRKKKDVSGPGAAAGRSKCKQKLHYDHSTDRNTLKHDGRTSKSKDKLKDSFSESSVEDSIYANSYKIGNSQKQKITTGGSTNRDPNAVTVLLRQELGGLRNSGDISRPVTHQGFLSDPPKTKKKFHVHLVKKDGMPFVSASGKSLPLRSGTSSARELGVRRHLAAKIIQRWVRQYVLRVQEDASSVQRSKDELPSWLQQAQKNKEARNPKKPQASKIPGTGLPVCRKAHSPNKQDGKDNSLLSEEVERIIHSELRSLVDQDLGPLEESRSLVRSAEHKDGFSIKDGPQHQVFDGKNELRQGVMTSGPGQRDIQPRSLRKNIWTTGEEAHPSTFAVPEALASQAYRESDVSELALLGQPKPGQKSSSRIHSRIASMKQAEQGLLKGQVPRGPIATAEGNPQAPSTTNPNKPVVPKIGLLEWNKLAKDQYENWGTVTGLIATIEAKMGGRAAEDVQQLFKKLEVFAEMSKKSLKDALIGYDPGVSNQPSDTRSHRQDSVLKGSSLFERKGPERATGIKPVGTDAGVQVDHLSVELSRSIDVESRHRLSSKRSSKAVLERWIEPAQLGRGSPSVKASGYNFYDKHRESLPSDTKVEKLGLDGSSRRKGKPLLKLDDPSTQTRTLEDKVQSTEDLVYRRASQDKDRNLLNQPPTSPMSDEDYRRLESLNSGLPSQVDHAGTFQSVSGILDPAQHSFAVVPTLLGNTSQNQLPDPEIRPPARPVEGSLASQLSDHGHGSVTNSRMDRAAFTGLKAVRSESQNSVELEGSKDNNEGGTNGTPLQEVQVSTLNWSYNQEHSSPLQEPKPPSQPPAADVDEHDMCQEYPSDLPMDEVEEPHSQMGSGTQVAPEPENGGVSLKYYKENPQLDALTGNFTMPYRYYSQFGNDAHVAEDQLGDQGEEDQEGNRNRPTQQTASVPHSSRILEFSNSLLPTIRSMDSTATKENGLELTLGGVNQMRPPTPEGPLYPQESLNLWTEKQAFLEAREQDELAQVYRDSADYEDTLGDRISQDLMEALIEEAISEQQEIKFRLSVCPQDDQMKVCDDISGIEAMYGIRTNLASVGEYLNLLVDFLLETQAEDLIAKYNQGHEMDPLETIKILRENEVHMYMSEGENQELMALSPEYEYQDLPMALLLDSEIFDILKTEMLSNLEDSTEIGRLIQLQGVFHKSIFDSFNEIISTLWQRDVAIDFLGLVMYRKQQPLKKLSGKEDLEKILIYAKDIALDYASMMCGTIRDKEDSMVGFVRGMDANGLNQLREDRLIKMLAMEIFDKEKFWVDYSQEMLISLIDCADKVCEDLVAEVVEDMVKLHAESSVGHSED